MIASVIYLPLLQTAGSWTVQFGPWTLPPMAWMPATAVIGALALRARSRARVLPGDDAPEP